MILRNIRRIVYRRRKHTTHGEIPIYESNRYTFIVRGNLPCIIKPIFKLVVLEVSHDLIYICFASVMAHVILIPTHINNSRNTLTNNPYVNNSQIEQFSYGILTLDHSDLSLVYVSVMERHHYKND